MQTPDTIERQADDAMARINQQINRSSGQPVSEGTESAQHILCHAPQATVQRIDTQHLQDTRAIERFGSAALAAPCPPGFCGFDVDCSDRECPGHPSHTVQWTPRRDAEEAEEAARSMRMLGWALVVLVVVCCVTVVAFFIGLNS